MDKTPQLMFALQSPVGLKFGATVSLDSERITFEMDVELPKGSVCNFRMELVGVESTVMGSIRVDRILPKRQGSVQRYVARIMEMPDEDRQAFDGWRRDQATGGISRRLDRDPEAIKQRIVDSMRGATEAEARMVLDKMNQKSIYKRKSADIVEGDPFGLAQEGSAELTQDSTSMRASLREQASKLPADTPTPVSAPAAQEKADPAPEASTPTPPVPSTTASASTGEPNWMRPIDTSDADASPPTDWMDGKGEPQPIDLSTSDLHETTPAPQAPRAPVTESTATAAPTPTASLEEPLHAEGSTGFSIPSTAPAPPPEVATPVTPSFPPTITVDASQTPIEIDVRFGDKQSFVERYNNELKASTICIPDPQLNQLYTPVKLSFTFHDQQTMSIFGQTVSETSEGMAIALEFNTQQRLILEHLARP